MDLNKLFSEFENWSQDQIKDNFDKVYPALIELASIVFNTYHSRTVSNYMQKEDLIQEAICNAYNTLIKDEQFDKSKGSLKNYLFTGMRNTMTNILYHVRKESPVDIVYGDMAEGTIHSAHAYIKYAKLSSYIRNINYLYTSEMVHVLENMGISIQDKPFLMPPKLRVPEDIKNVIQSYAFHRLLIIL